MAEKISYGLEGSVPGGCSCDLGVPATLKRRRCSSKFNYVKLTNPICSHEG